MSGEWPLGTNYNYFISYFHQSEILPVDMCEKCGRGTNYVTLRPFYLEGGNGNFGDFATTIGCGELIQKKWINVAVFESDGVRFEPVVICKGNGIILKSYKGPEFLEMVVECAVPYIEELTTFEDPDVCPVCQRSSRRLSGFEEPPDADGNPCPRKPGMGIFVRRSDLGTCNIFKAKQTGRGCFCTEEFRQRIESMNLTNITFWECGTVIEDE